MMTPSQYEQRITNLEAQVLKLYNFVDQLVDVQLRHQTLVFGLLGLNDSPDLTSSRMSSYDADTGPGRGVIIPTSEEMTSDVISGAIPAKLRSLSEETRSERDNDIPAG